MGESDGRLISEVRIEGLDTVVALAEPAAQTLKDYIEGALAYRAPGGGGNPEKAGHKLFELMQTGLAGYGIGIYKRIAAKIEDPSWMIEYTAHSTQLSGSRDRAKAAEYHPHIRLHSKSLEEDIRLSVVFWNDRDWGHYVTEAILSSAHNGKKDKILVQKVEHQGLVGLKMAPLSEVPAFLGLTREVANAIRPHLEELEHYRERILHELRMHVAHNQTLGKHYKTVLGAAETEQLGMLATLLEKAGVAVPVRVV